jgi:hypothetical protein
MVKQYGGPYAIINNTVFSFINHPALEKWLNSFQSSSPEEKEIFNEVEFSLDMARYAFTLAIPMVIDLPTFKAELENANFGAFTMHMESEGSGKYFIYLEKDNRRIALYNGN